MIENTNASKTPSNYSSFETKKYVGVASVNIVAVNPTNEKLRQFGWDIPADAAEPEYVKTVEDPDTHRTSTRSRVCLLAQIQDMKEKPIVSLNFFARPEVSASKDGQKGKIIDMYGRTAWGTRDEIKAKQVPQYSSGPANIATPYRMCHPGEEELVRFMMKYLNVTPLQMFDSKTGKWNPSKNPGRLSFDDWSAICNGNMREVAEMLGTQPDNCVKVVLGVQTTDENKTYQTFINTGYIGNGQRVDYNTGVYTRAEKLIDDFKSGLRSPDNYTFSAAPVREWTESATEVTDQSGLSYDASESLEPQEDDLPWA